MSCASLSWRQIAEDRNPRSEYLRTGARNFGSARWKDGKPTGSKEGGSMTGASRTPQPRFVRIWRGRTARDKAYERYWLANGIAPLEAKGALRVEMLREDRDTETEFVTISYWDSIEAMTGGKGDDPATPIIWSAIRSSSSSCPSGCKS
jgi:hypothetical protein